MKKLLLIIGLTTALPFTRPTDFKNESQTADQEFLNTTVKAIIAGACINGFVALTRENYLPAKALLPAAVLIGAGNTLLWKLDKQDLAKNPHCGAARRKSPVLRSLVVAVGLLPVIFSESQAGEQVRKILSPVFETAWKAGEMALSGALSRV